MGEPMNKQSQDIIETLKLLPNKIKQQQKRVMTFVFDIEKTKSDIEREDNKIMLEIINAKDENNKNVYTNDTTRNLALQESRTKNTVTQQLLKNLTEAESAYREQKIELEHQQNTLSAMRAIARIIGANTE